MARDGNYHIERRVVAPGESFELSRGERILDTGSTPGGKVRLTVLVYDGPKDPGYEPDEEF